MGREGTWIPPVPEKRRGLGGCGGTGWAGWQGKGGVLAQIPALWLLKYTSPPTQSAAYPEVLPRVNSLQTGNPPGIFTTSQQTWVVHFKE